MTKNAFVLDFPTSFQNSTQRLQNRIEINLGIYKELQNYKFYRQYVV